MVVPLYPDSSVKDPEEVGCFSLEGNLGLLLIADILFLTLDFLEAIDTIYVMLWVSTIFTILKGLEIFSRTSISRESLSFFGNLTCFGVTVKLSVSKSYWVTSEMESAFRTLVARSSAPRSISLA